MKKIISMFAIVLALGVTSCGDENEVAPVPPVGDEITLADFDGYWSFESVDYNSVNYTDCEDPSYRNQLSSDAVMTGLSFDIDGANSKIDFYDCDGTHIFNGFTKDVSFDVNTMKITFTGYEFVITKSDLESTPKTASIKLTKALSTRDVLNATHNVTH